MTLNPAFAFVLPLALLLPSVGADEDFVYPKHPFAPSGPAPSKKVTNGTVFESGSLDRAKAHVLVLPKTAHVETYDGRSIRFFLTKSLRCMGHPPASMAYDKERGNFGIAQRRDEDALVVSTFGEWSNRGGSASIRMVVLVPRDLKVELRDELHGAKSAASAKFDLEDKLLKRRYWYAARHPKTGWATIETQLHFNRFLAAH